MTAPRRRRIRSPAPAAKEPAPAAKAPAPAPKTPAPAAKAPAPIILVTNDDGIHAAGLTALTAGLADLGDVYVIAPDREQSAVGHALTLHRPLRVDRIGERRLAVNGTPSDCVNLGVLGLLPHPPALVVSGINHGSNLGDDVTYSGTVSAAMEGVLLGVPSIAVSLERTDAGFADATRIARLIAARVLVEGLSPKTLLNVNVPGVAPKGIRVALLGRRVYKERIIEQTDPRGRTYYWIGAGPPLWDAAETTDIAAIHDGFASVTPLHLDLTDYTALARMTDWGRALTAQYRGRSRTTTSHG